MKKIMLLSGLLPLCLLAGCTGYPDAFDEDLGCEDAFKHYSRLHDEVIDVVEWNAEPERQKRLLRKRAAMVYDYQLRMEECVAEGVVDAETLATMRRNMDTHFSVGNIDLADESTYDGEEASGDE